MADGVSNEPVIASIPAPISVEPRTATPVEVVETSRQAEEARVKAAEPAAKPKAAEPVVEKAKPLSTREAIRAAALKVEAIAEKAKPLASEPVAAKEAKAAAAEPAKSAETAPKDNAPVHGADGKFVSTKAAPAVPVDSKASAAEVAATSAAAAKGAEPAAAEPAKTPALPSHTASPAPARFSPAAKERWAEAPEEVRTETERAVKELTAGFEKHRAAAERDGTLVEFHEMAGKSGKNLKDVVAQYVGMEQLLRTDLVGGLELIAKNAGFSLRDVAAKILNQTPEETAASSDKRVIELEAKLAKLEGDLGTLTTERETTRTTTTHESVTKFAADHPRFEELSGDIAFFLKSGRTKDLAEAYTLAERLNPAPAPVAQATEPAAAVASSAPPAAAIAKPTLVPPVAHTDAGTRSIAGTPTAGSDPVRKQPSNSIRDAIRRATAAAG